MKSSAPEGYEWLVEALTPLCDGVRWKEFDCGTQIGIAAQWELGKGEGKYFRTAIVVEDRNTGTSINEAIAHSELTRKQVIQSFIDRAKRR